MTIASVSTSPPLFAGTTSSNKNGRLIWFHTLTPLLQLQQSFHHSIEVLNGCHLTLPCHSFTNTLWWITLFEGRHRHRSSTTHCWTMLVWCWKLGPKAAWEEKLKSSKVTVPTQDEQNTKTGIHLRKNNIYGLGDNVHRIFKVGGQRHPQSTSWCLFDLDP